MERLKSFITRYSKVYIGLVLLIWLAFFFVPWDKPVLGISINLLIMQKVLLVFGILSILMALLSKKCQSLCFWIDLLFFSLDKSIYPICDFADFWQLKYHKNQRG